MNVEEIAKQRTDASRNLELSAGQYAAMRERADGVVRGTVEYHARKLRAWQWLDRALKELPPTTEEEESLHSLLSMCARERF